MILIFFTFLLFSNNILAFADKEEHGVSLSPSYGRIEYSHSPQNVDLESVSLKGNPLLQKWRDKEKNVTEKLRKLGVHYPYEPEVQNDSFNIFTSELKKRKLLTNLKKNGPFDRDFKISNFRSVFQKMMEGSPSSISPNIVAINPTTILRRDEGRVWITEPPLFLQPPPLFYKNNENTGNGISSLQAKADPKLVQIPSESQDYFIKTSEIPQSGNITFHHIYINKNKQNSLSSMDNKIEESNSGKLETSIQVPKGIRIIKPISHSKIKGTMADGLRKANPPLRVNVPLHKLITNVFSRNKRPYRKPQQSFSVKNNKTNLDSFKPVTNNYTASGTIFQGFRVPNAQNKQNEIDNKKISTTFKVIKLKNLYQDPKESAKKKLESIKFENEIQNNKESKQNEKINFGFPHSQLNTGNNFKQLIPSQRETEVKVFENVKNKQQKFGAFRGQQFPKSRQQQFPKKSTKPFQFSNIEKGFQLFKTTDTPNDGNFIVNQPHNTPNLVVNKPHNIPNFIASKPLKVPNFIASKPHNAPNFIASKPQSTPNFSANKLQHTPNFVVNKPQQTPNNELNKLPEPQPILNPFGMNNENLFLLGKDTPNFVYGPVFKKNIGNTLKPIIYKAPPFSHTPFQPRPPKPPSQSLFLKTPKENASGKELPFKIPKENFVYSNMHHSKSTGLPPQPITNVFDGREILPSHSSHSPHSPNLIHTSQLPHASLSHHQTHPQPLKHSSPISLATSSPIDMFGGYESPTAPDHFPYPNTYVTPKPLTLGVPLPVYPRPNSKFINVPRALVKPEVHTDPKTFSYFHLHQTPPSPYLPSHAENSQPNKDPFSELNPSASTTNMFNTSHPVFFKPPPPIFPPPPVFFESPGGHSFSVSKFKHPSNRSAAVQTVKPGTRSPSIVKLKIMNPQSFAKETLKAKKHFMTNSQGSSTVHNIMMAEAEPLSSLGKLKKKYKYNYIVDDPHKRLVYGHSERGHGNITRGDYFVTLQNGRTQHVTYTTDEKGGYKADVKYFNS